MRRLFILILLISSLPLATAHAHDETFVTADGRYALRHPNHWIVHDIDGIIAIETRPDLLIADVATLNQDDIVGYLLTPEQLETLGFGFKGEQTLLEALQILDDAGIPADEVGFAPRRVGLRANSLVPNLNGFMLLFHLEDGGLTGLIVVAPDIERHSEAVYRMAASLHRVSNRGVVSLISINTTEPSPLENRYTATNNHLELGYPSGFSIVESNTSGVIGVLSAAEVTSGSVPSGELSLYVAAPDSLQRGIFFDFGPNARYVAIQWSAIFRLVYSHLETTNFSDLELVTIAQRDTYLMSFGSVFGDIVVLTFALDSGEVVLVYAIAADGEIDTMLATILAITASIQGPSIRTKAIALPHLTQP